MNNWVNRTVATALLFTISGCTGYGVTFQSAPNTTLSNCHPALVGDWQVIEGELNAPASSSQDFLSISADCAAIYSINLKQESGKQVAEVGDFKNSNAQIQFSDDYVVITPKTTSLEITPEIKIPSGKIILKINKSKEGVILRPVDLDKTAQLVLQKKLSGQLYIDRDVDAPMKAYNIYVHGDAKQIATYLNTLDIYSDGRLLLISTSPKEVKLIQKAIKNFHSDKKPK